MKLAIRNIYLAEDDMDDVYFFKFALNKLKLKCNLIVANDGLELVSKLKNGQPEPDIIFVDINMPVMNGLETLDNIKKDPKFNTVPVIVYSTSQDPTDIKKAFKYGASSYLVKPFDLEGLEKLIAKVLSYDWEQHIPKQLSEFVISP
ncbi:response regulator [Flavobacterium sp.]|uniref:response regulator n=1 Tax=Flavobacterium sp. TaxID=239 RepID=UPI004033318A